MEILEYFKIIPEYLKAVLSFPVTVLIISLIFIFRFTNEIRIFLKNTKIFRAGPIEFQTQSEATAARPKKSIRNASRDLQQKGISLTDVQIKQLEAEFSRLTEEASSKEQQIKDKDRFIKYLIYRSERYEFLYLNLYLVTNTKSILNWFNTMVGVTKELFNLYFQTTITTPLEREAIFNALLSNGLIELSGANYKISDKGIRFLRFIGFIK